MVYHKENVIVKNYELDNGVDYIEQGSFVALNKTTKKVTNVISGTTPILGVLVNKMEKTQGKVLGEQKDLPSIVFRGQVTIKNNSGAKIECGKFIGLKANGVIKDMGDTAVFGETMGITLETIEDGQYGDIILQTILVGLSS